MPALKMREGQFKYDVALSFAEEDRKFAECVARQLRRKGLNPYYDRYHEIDMWGENLYTHLDEIYRNQARACVIFISVHYKRKLWTKHERESAQARAFKENEAYIWPFRLDNTEIPGIRDNIAYFSRDRFDCIKLAAAIADKLRQVRPQEPPEFTPDLGQLKSFAPRKLSRKFFAEKISYFFSSKSRSGSVLLTTGGVVLLGFLDKFTPIDVLAHRIREKSKQTSITRCSDGSFSLNRGSGTCSSHGGVDVYVDTLIYIKTMEECREEAAGISWLPQ